MFTALTVKTIDFPIFDMILEADTIIAVKELADGSVVGMFAGKTFDISPDEYVKVTGNFSNITH
jgi:hypothetical protein